MQITTLQKDIHKQTDFTTVLYELSSVFLRECNSQFLSQRSSLLTVFQIPCFVCIGVAKLRLKQHKGIQDVNRALAIDRTIFQAYLTRAAYYGVRKQVTSNFTR